MFQKYFHCKIESNEFCSSNNNIDISDWKIKQKQISTFSIKTIKTLNFWSGAARRSSQAWDWAGAGVHPHQGRGGGGGEIKLFPQIFSILFTFLCPGCLHYPRLAGALQSGVAQERGSAGPQHERDDQEGQQTLSAHPENWWVFVRIG